MFKQKMLFREIEVVEMHIYMPMYEQKLKPSALIQMS